MSIPTTVEILIPAGTIVERRFNRNGRVCGEYVTLKGDCYVAATRHDDGGYGYALSSGAVYYASAGTVEVLGSPAA